MNATQVADVILRGPAEEVSSQLADLLSIIKDRLSDRPELAKSLPFRIVKRGAQDAARRKKLLQLYKVDPETVTLLQENHTQWAQDPMLFWCHSLDTIFNLPATSAQAVGRYLCARRDNA